LKFLQEFYIQNGRYLRSTLLSSSRSEEDESESCDWQCSNLDTHRERSKTSLHWNCNNDLSNSAGPYRWKCKMFFHKMNSTKFAWCFLFNFSKQDVNISRVNCRLKKTIVDQTFYIFIKTKYDFSKINYIIFLKYGLLEIMKMKKKTHFEYGLLHIYTHHYNKF
jgi:hypothetical protein